MNAKSVVPTTHWPRLGAEQLRTLSGCVTRVLADSNRTKDIIIAEELLAQAQLPKLIDSGIFAQGESRELWEQRPRLVDVDLDALRELPADTLGGAFARFLDDNALDLALTDQPTPFTSDADAAYLLDRLRQSHDLWHVLLGLGIQGHEEVCVHAFSYAQTGLPSSAAIVALGSVKHMLLEARPSAYTLMARAHRAGQRAVPLLGVYWERHFDEPLSSVRARVGVTPLLN